MEFADLQDHVKNSRLRTRFLSRAVVVHIKPDPRDLGPDIKERWESERVPLGRGAQGQVFLQKCTQNPMQSSITRRVAKKIPLKGSETHKLYPEELAAIMRFSHERYARNFVQPLGWYESDSSVYITMEYLPAGDLEAYLQNHSLTEDNVREIIAQVLKGLSIMHNEDFAHRDLKPQNVLIQSCPTADTLQPWWVKLGDFGISKRLAAAGESTITSIGTPKFMGPELFSGGSTYRGLANGPACLASDMWALGAMAFYIMTKQHIFGDTEKMLQYAANPDTLFPYQRLEEIDVTTYGQGFIKALLRPNPKDRLLSRSARHHAWFGDWTLRNDTIYNASEGSSASSVASEIDLASDRRGMTTLSSCDTEQQTESRERFDTRESESISAPLKGDLLDLLQSMGVTDVHKPNCFGWVPLHGAAQDGDEKIASLLLLHLGAEPDTKDFKGVTPLMLAARYGYQAIAQLLLQQGANIEAKNDKGCTSLMHAANQGHEAVVSLLLQQGANIEAKDEKGFTSLMHAASQGHESIISLLLQQDVNVEAESVLGFTSLIIAVREGHEAVVGLLLQQGANIEAKDNRGYTSLMLAVRKGHEAIAELLLQQCANIEAKSSQTEVTPLMIAVQEANVAIAGLLLQQGANVDAKGSEKGPTSLMIAVQEGHEAIAELLLQQGANIEAKSSQTEVTPLIIAVHEGHVAIIELLLQQGANIEAKTILGFTPLMISVQEGHVAIVGLLLQLNANVEATARRHGYTSLLLAVRYKQASIVELLLHKGANIDAKDSKNGWTSLMTAISFGLEEIAKCLLDQGADIEMKDKRGERPLIMAIEQGSEFIVQLLLQKSADTKIISACGFTPLGMAAREGHDRVARLLIASGAEVHYKDSHGNTPLTIAIIKEHEGMRKLLIEEGAGRKPSTSTLIRQFF